MVVDQGRRDCWHQDWSNRGVNVGGIAYGVVVGEYQNQIEIGWQLNLWW